MTGLGLETPTYQVVHDGANGVGGFGSFVYNIAPHDQLRLVTSLRQDFFQIPNPSSLEISQPFPYSPEAVVVTPMPGLFQDDTQKEKDALINFSWVHTFSNDGLLTLSPFFHSNGSHYDSSSFDNPNAGRLSSQLDLLRRTSHHRRNRGPQHLGSRILRFLAA